MDIYQANLEKELPEHVAETSCEKIKEAIRKAIEQMIGNLKEGRKPGWYEEAKE